MVKHPDKILVLYTGGTIGMKNSNQGYVPTDDFERLFEKCLNPYQHTLPEYKFVSLDQLIDSANLVPKNWSYIGNKLLSEWANYEGFVILHGTDTMAYSASALSFMFQGLDKPIVLTGSQIPMCESNSDAIDNVVNALKFAASKLIYEVCICFDNKVLRGNRSTKIKSEALDAFNTPNLPWLTTRNNNSKKQNFLHLPTIVQHFLVPDFSCNAVLVLQVYPGISVQTFEGVFAKNKFKAIIIQTYGMGNTPNNDNSLLHLLKIAAKKEMIIVNITQCLIGGVNQSTYSTGKHLHELGVISGKDMTLEAAFAKLHFLIASGLNTSEIKQKILEPLAGELTC